MRMLYALGAAGVGLLVTAYLFYDVATQRIDGFLFARGRPHIRSNRRCAR